MGIQLGLTESARFDLSGDEAVGYWSVTVSALGYKDYTYKFHADKENIAQHVVIASDSDEVKALQSTIKLLILILKKKLNTVLSHILILKQNIKKLWML